nr:hypothetical protein [Tanacetum cinerariifolium]
RVESFDNKESLGEDASKQGSIDEDEEITLVNVQNVDEEMFDVNVLDGKEMFVVEQEVATNKENDEVNVVEEVVEVINTVLEEMKNTKPKNKRVVIQELGKSTTTISSQLSSQKSQDKGKGIMIEPVKPIKKKDQISFNEETTLKLQAEFDEEERFAREKAEKEEEANIAAFKRVKKFEDFRTELVEGREKRAGIKLIQENTKKQKVEDDKETSELKQYLEIILDKEEVTIDDIPLAVKSPSIVDRKIHKEGRKSYY